MFSPTIYLDVCLTHNPRELVDLNHDLHWFCPRSSTTDDGLYFDEDVLDGDGEETDAEKTERSKRVRAAEERRDLTLACCPIFAFDGEDARPYQDMFQKGLKRQLSRCSMCVREFHRSRTLLIQNLEAQHEEEDVRLFMDKFNQINISRIVAGLDQMTKVLKTLPPEQRNIKSTGDEGIYALFEACNCVPFLRDESALRQHFDTPLTLVQSKKKLTLPTYVPGMTVFLYGSNPERRAWAVKSAEQIKRPLAGTAFEFSVKPWMEEAMDRVQMFSLEHDFLPVFWQATRIIISKLTRQVINNHLRSMKSDLFSLILDHFSVDGWHFVDLLKSTRTLLATSPGDFWDAMGSIPAQTVVENIFRSPGLQRMCTTTQEREPLQLEERMDWTLQIVNSVQPANLVAPLRTLTDQLLHGMQQERYSRYARGVCLEKGLRCLLTSIRVMSDKMPVGPIVTQLLQMIANDHLQLIMQELQDIETRTDRSQLEKMEELCLEIVEAALALDISSLTRDRRDISNTRTLDHEVGVGSLNIWKASMRRTKAGSPILPVSLLSGSIGLLSLEKFGSLEAKDAPKHTQEWNNALDERLGCVVSDLLESLDSFTAEQLVDVLRDPQGASGLLALLFNGEALGGEESRVHQAALSVLKVLSNEDGRRGSIMHLVRSLFPEVMSAVEACLKTIASTRAFGPSAVALKICADILDCFCSTSDGVLRSTKTASVKYLERLERFWSSIWALLGLIFEHTEAWSDAGHDKQLMQDFCRGTMDFADRAFDQYSIFATALRQSSERVEAQDMRVALLAHPKRIFGKMIKWLRLRDEYLIDKAVSLTVKILGRLHQAKIKIDADAARFIENAAKAPDHPERIKTKLSMQQKAELQRALDQHLGQSADDGTDVDAPATAKPSGMRAQPATTTTKSSRGGTIDVGAWSDASKREKELRLQEGSRNRDTSVRAPTQQPRLKWPDVDLTSRLTTQNAALRQQQESQAFLAKRKQQKAEAESRKQAAIQKARGVTAGSSLQGLGDIGKDHNLKSKNVMVSSGEESSDDPEDELDIELFGPTEKQERRAKRAAAARIPEVRNLAEKKAGPTKIQRMQRSARDMRARLAPNLMGLHRIILKWEFFHEGDYPPGANEHQFRRVANSFQDPKTYQETFTPLLTLEAWQGMVRTREEGANKSYELKIVTQMRVDAYIEFTSSIKHVENRELQLLEGDIILLSTAKAPLAHPEAAHGLARVSRVQRQRMFAEVVYQAMPGGPLSSSLVPQGMVFGVKVQSITPLEREFGALQGLPYYDLCTQILKALPSMRIRHSERDVQLAQEAWKVNRAQSEAINAALHNEGFSLIQGPPGSGKTKTIVAIVGGLLSQSLNASEKAATAISMPKARGIIDLGADAPPKKLLVCAPSNAAVDELVMRLKAGVNSRSGKQHALKIVRIGRSEAINPQVKDVTMDELIAKKLGTTDRDRKAKERNQEAFREHQLVSGKLAEARSQENSGSIHGREAEALHESIGALIRQKRALGMQIDNIRDDERNAGREADLDRKKAQQTILNEAHVICATLSGSGHDMFQTLNIEFDTVIIDEAAQCVEMSSLIPLKYGCVKCIMVGDPKQLPPTVFSREAAKFQYEQSLFVRMQTNRPDVVYLLDTQYRMHPDISAFPSRAFYDGLLQDGPGMAVMRQRPWHASALLAPYRFFDVKGQHQHESKGHSLVNHAEIDVALALFKRLTADFHDYDYTGRVGVITPYKSQLRALKNRFSLQLGNSVFDTIEFNTTDAFQGRESDIIIFSCVRASPTGGIGFLQDIRRMNVGLTRAKCSLWVLGNSSSLVRGQWWRRLVEDAQARDAYTTGNVLGMLRQSSTVFPAATNTDVVRSMLDVDNHVPQMAVAESAANDLKHADSSRKGSNGERVDATATAVGGDKMEGVRYRAEDRMTAYHHQKRPRTGSNFASHPTTRPGAPSDAADVDMDNTNGTQQPIALAHMEMKCSGPDNTQASKQGEGPAAAAAPVVSSPSSTQAPTMKKRPTSAMYNQPRKQHRK